MSIRHHTTKRGVYMDIWNNYVKESDYLPQQWHPNGPAFSSFAGSVAGKDLEGEKEMYINVEWKERVEKWKAKQEKRGLVSKGGEGNDQGDLIEQDDFLMAEARQPLWRKVPLPSSKINPYRIVIVLRLINMRGLDGIQGPVYVGTGCVFNRQALYRYDPPVSEKCPKMTCDCWPSWCCCCCGGSRKKKSKSKSKKGGLQITCTAKLKEKNNIAIWQKPTNHMHCKINRKVLKTVPTIGKSYWS